MDRTKVEEYKKLPLEEIDKLLKENHEILNKIWEEDDGSSWENYSEKCRPYWKKAHELYTAQALLTPYEDIKFEPLDDNEKEECLFPIDEFREACKYKCFTSYDGFGYYATETEKSDIDASPEAFADDYVRNDFTHVVWYNK